VVIKRTLGAKTTKDIKNSWQSKLKGEKKEKETFNWRLHLNKKKRKNDQQRNFGKSNDKYCPPYNVKYKQEIDA
jgi:hypothetical protein